MEFHDVLHGFIQLGLPFNRLLIEELLVSPEVERLRNMRLMNFSVPLIQELASAKRLPHSIGVCFLAQQIAKRSLSSEKKMSTLMVAGLLHDAAIPPYGHLVEATLRKKHPEFDHSQVLRGLLLGKYHPSNSYHQILPGRSLEVPRILSKFGIDPEEVLALVQPTNRIGTAIAAQIDLDNIDNVHRMAALIGWAEARPNMQRIADNAHIDQDLRLEFRPEAVPAIKLWQELRQRLYTLIIAHPASVAQNAFQSALVKQSIEQGVMTPDTWYINEPKYEESLRGNAITQPLANQLLSGSHYRLVDYVWFTATGEPPSKNWNTVFEQIETKLPPLGPKETYFSWVENGLISRTLDIRLTTKETEKIGTRSFSCLIARVHTDTQGYRGPGLTQGERAAWRTSVGDVFVGHVDGWLGQAFYPEDYNGSFFRLEDDVRQLELG